MEHERHTLRQQYTFEKRLGSDELNETSNDLCIPTNRYVKWTCKNRNKNNLMVKRQRYSNIRLTQRKYFSEYFKITTVSILTRFH